MTWNLFQVLAVSVLACLFVLTIVATATRRTSRREGFFWSLVWLVAAIAVIRPDLTVVVARALGIGRGADLVLYCSVVVMLIGFMMVYVRLRDLRRSVALLVRELAIRDAQASSAPTADRPDDPPARTDPTDG